MRKNSFRIPHKYKEKANLFAIEDFRVHHQLNYHIHSIRLNNNHLNNHHHIEASNSGSLGEFQRTVSEFRPKHHCQRKVTGGSMETIASKGKGNLSPRHKRTE